MKDMWPEFFSMVQGMEKLLDETHIYCKLCLNYRVFYGEK